MRSAILVQRKIEKGPVTESALLFNADSITQISTALSTTSGELITASGSTGPKAVT
jgi:hypothetical protein